MSCTTNTVHHCFSVHLRICITCWLSSGCLTVQPNWLFNKLSRRTYMSHGAEILNLFETILKSDLPLSANFTDDSYARSVHLNAANESANNLQEVRQQCYKVLFGLAERIQWNKRNKVILWRCPPRMLIYSTGVSCCMLESWGCMIVQEMKSTWAKSSRKSNANQYQ